MSGSSISMNQDKKFVLQFLKNIDKEHSMEREVLERQILHLSADKKRLEGQLNKIKNELSQIQKKLRQVREQNTITCSKFVQMQAKYQSSQSRKYQLSYCIQDLPKNLIQSLNQCKATEFKIKPQFEQKCKGPMACIVWGMDGESFEKYEKINSTFAHNFMKKKADTVGMLLIYDPKIQNLIKNAYQN